MSKFYPFLMYFLKGSLKERFTIFLKQIFVTTMIYMISKDHMNKN